MFNIAEYRRRGRRLSDHLPWAGLLHPRILLNKDGSFMSVARFRGPDADSLTDHERIAIRARANNALRRLGSRWCLHVEARRAPSQAYPDSMFPDPVTAAIDRERRASVATAGAQFESSHYLALTYLPPEERASRGRNLFIESTTKQEHADYRRELAQFERQSAQIVDLLAGFVPEIAWLESSDLLTCLHGCVSTRTMDVALPPVPFYLDDFLTDDDLTGGFEPRLGQHHLRTVSVRAYPQRTVPGLLDALNRLPIAYRWVVRWLPMDKAQAERHIGAIRRQWFAKRKGLAALLREAITKEPATLEDSDSLAKSEDADEALQCLGAELCSYGHLTLTVTVSDPDARIADEQAALVQQAIDGVGMVSKVETLNAVEAWLGSLPGHAYADVRRPVIGSLNLCDLIPLACAWSGPPRCNHLNGPAVIQAVTAGASPFRLCLHQGDVGHTMVCGPTGAGKSTLLNLLAAQWRRYPDAQVYFFDKGGSCKVLTHAVGGDYYDLGADGGIDDAGLSFQPLGRVDSESERVWAQDWLLDILTREGVAVTPPLKEEVWRVLELLGTGYDSPDRTLSSFVNLVQSQAAKEALRRYTLAGPYGRLLDAHEDHLHAGMWQAFETEQLLRHPAAVAPTLTYLFHRLEDRFAGEGSSETGGGRPTLLVLDEAWVFLADGMFAAKINEWLKVLRKRNVAVVFATQSLSDVQASSIAPALIENCPTRLFLPNPRALEPSVRSVYEAFGLNNQQLRLLAGATPKRDYYYQSREGNRLFDLAMGPLALALCASSSHADRVLADQLYREHPSEDFARAFLRHKGMALNPSG